MKIKKKSDKINCFFSKIDSLLAVLLLAALALLVLIFFAYLLRMEQLQSFQPPLILSPKNKVIKVKQETFNDQVAMYYPLSQNLFAEYNDKLYFNEEILEFSLGDELLKQLYSIDERPEQAIKVNNELYFFNTIEEQDQSIINRLYAYRESNSSMALLLSEESFASGEIYEWQEHWGILANDDNYLYLSYLRGDYAPLACHNYWNNSNELYDVYGALFYSGVKILNLNAPQQGFINKELSVEQVNYGKSKAENCLNNLLPY